MALFKRIMAVIKEELFDNKNSDKTEKKIDVPQGRAVYSPQQDTDKKNRATEVRKISINAKAEVKKQQPTKKTVKVTVNKENSPEQITEMYNNAKAAEQNGKTDVALELYKNAFESGLVFVCEKLDVDCKGLTNKLMLRRICSRMNISNKNTSKLHTLLATIQGDVVFSDKAKAVKSIATGMELFEKVVLKRIPCTTKTQEKNTKTKNPGKKVEKDKIPVSNSLMGRCGKLSVSLGVALRKVKTASEAGDVNMVFQAYDDMLLVALNELCSMLKINTVNETKASRMHMVCSELKLPQKRHKSMAELVQAVGRRGQFSQMKDTTVLALIDQRMTSLLDVYIATAKSNGMVYESHTEILKAQKKGGTKGARMSFKARENTGDKKKFNINKEFPKVKTYLDSAGENRDRGKFYGALHDIRMALEVMVKGMCRRLSVNVAEKEPLYDMIEKLKESGYPVTQATVYLRTVLSF